MGKRECNEDQTTMKPKFTLDGKSGSSSALSFFGVFDGHGGIAAAEYSRERILENLKFSLLQNLSVEDSLRYAFVRTEFDFFEESPPEETSGTTAVCLFIDNALQKFWVANVGDSRAILCRAGIAIQLSNDHRATNPAEVERVVQAGGFIRNRRAMGRLECFRTIGDSDVDSRVITSEPEIITGKFVPEDEFIVLGCDGLYDVMENQEICDFIKNMLNTGSKPNEIAPKLARHAIEVKGSRDNVSVVLVVLQIPTGEESKSSSASSRPIEESKSPPTPPTKPAVLVLSDRSVISSVTDASTSPLVAPDASIGKAEAPSKLPMTSPPSADPVVSAKTDSLASKVQAALRFASKETLSTSRTASRDASPFPQEIAISDVISFTPAPSEASYSEAPTDVVYDYPGNFAPIFDPAAPSSATWPKGIELMPPDASDSGSINDFESALALAEPPKFKPGSTLKMMHAKKEAASKGVSL
jgi:protein phosphatase 2C family protein 2/3